MSKNWQTCFKNLVVFLPRDFESMLGHFLTICKVNRCTRLTDGFEDWCCLLKIVMFLIRQWYNHWWNEKMWKCVLVCRSSIEETYSKSLLKLATKCSAANSHVG